ncbi:MAG: aldolase/citrate lyase family protein [Exilibacterium sp.]
MGLSVLVRIPLARSYLIAPVLDAGAEGVVFPCIQNRAEAERAVALCRYPPKGVRGLSVHRHLAYKSTDLSAENIRADDQVVVALMIENKLGLDACADIARVPGVDFLLEGAADLSAALDVSWETRHPSVLEAIASIDAIAGASKIAFCAIPRAKEDYVTWRTKGLSLFVLGTDRGVIRKGMKGHLSEFISSEHQ